MQWSSIDSLLDVRTQCAHGQAPLCIHGSMDLTTMPCQMPNPCVYPCSQATFVVLTYVVLVRVAFQEAGMRFSSVERATFVRSAPNTLMQPAIAKLTAMLAAAIDFWYKGAFSMERSV